MLFDVGFDALAPSFADGEIAGLASGFEHGQSNQLGDGADDFPFVLGIDVGDFGESRGHKLESEFSEAGFAGKAAHSEVVQIEAVGGDARARDEKCEELDAAHSGDGVRLSGVVNAPGTRGYETTAVVLLEIAGAFELHGDFQEVLMVVAAFELADDAVASSDDAANPQVADIAMLDAASEGFGPGSFGAQAAKKLPESVLPESELLGGRHILGGDYGKLSDGDLLGETAATWSVRA